MQPQHRGDRTSLSRTHPTLARSSPPTGLLRPPSPTTGRPGSRPPESPAPYARRNSVEPNWLAQPCRSASPPESSQRCLHANRRPQRQSARTRTAPQQRARSAQCRTPPVTIEHCAASPSNMTVTASAPGAACPARLATHNAAMGPAWLGDASKPYAPPNSRSLRRRRHARTTRSPEL